MWKLNIQYLCDNLRIGDRVVARVPGYREVSGNITNIIMWDNSSCPHKPKQHVSIDPVDKNITYHPCWLHVMLGSNLVPVCSRCIQSKGK